MDKKYRDYLKSPEWAKKRKAAFDRDNQCKLCGDRGAKTGNPLVVHHMTYERIFNEEMSDLITLCNKCHGYVHEESAGFKHLHPKVYHLLSDQAKAAVHLYVYQIDYISDWRGWQHDPDPQIEEHALLAVALSTKWKGNYKIAPAWMGLPPRPENQPCHADWVVAFEQGEPDIAFLASTASITWLEEYRKFPIYYIGDNPHANTPRLKRMAEVACV